MAAVPGHVQARVPRCSKKPARAVASTTRGKGREKVDGDKVGYSEAASEVAQNATADAEYCLVDHGDHDGLDPVEQTCDGGHARVGDG